MSDSDFRIRPARAEDVDALAVLLPRLAEFLVPEHRDPRELWEDDEKLLRRWGIGEADHCVVLAVEDAGGAVAGVSLASLREDPMNHRPAAHLEAIAIAPSLDGRGAGRALLAATERAVAERGAESMTLHVFANNARARHVYAGAGYDGEILRYYKRLEGSDGEALD